MSMDTVTVLGLPPGAVFRRAKRNQFADGCWDEVVSITYPPGRPYAERRMQWDPGSWVWQHIEPTHVVEDHHT